MKKLLSVILALVMLFALTACGGGGQEGIWFNNELGFDLTMIEIITENDTGVTLVNGIANGHSELLQLDMKEGYADVTATDPEGNTLEFVNVYLYDGTDVTFVMEDGTPWIEYPYAGSTARFDAYVTGAPAPEGAEYIGTFESDYGDLLYVYDDATFKIVAITGEVVMEGTCDFTDGLSLYGDGYSMFLALDEYGNLYGGEDVGTYFRVDYSDAPETPDTPDTPDAPDEPDVPDYSEVAVGASPEDYQGFWRYADGTFLQINGEEWNLYSDDGMTLYTWGPVEFEDDCAWLMNADGSSGGGKIWFDDQATLHDTAGTLTWWGEFLFAGGNDNAWLEGEWYYSDQGEILYFDGVQQFVWMVGDTELPGVYSFDGETIVFEFDSDGGIVEAVVKGDGYIYVVGDDGSYFYRSDEF